MTVARSIAKISTLMTVLFLMSVPGFGDTVEMKLLHFGDNANDPSDFEIIDRIGRPQEYSWYEVFPSYFGATPQLPAPPFIDCLRLGDNEFVFKLDSINPKDGLDYFAVDLNLDGEFSDDERIPFESKPEYLKSADNVSGYRLTSTPVNMKPFKVTYKCDGSKAEIEVHCQLTVVFDPFKFEYHSVRVTFVTKSIRKGVWDRNGSQCPLILVDRNCNGRFNDMNRILEDDPENIRLVEGDWLSLRLEGESSGEKPLSSILSLANEPFEATVTGLGDRLTLNQWSGPTGYLTPKEFQYPKSWPKKRASHCCYYVVYKDGIPVSTYGKTALPIGTWRLYRHTLMEFGEHYESSIFDAVVRKEASPVEVKEGETTELALGPPCHVEIDFNPRSFSFNEKGARQLRLRLKIFDSIGAELTSIQADGRRPESPTITIADEEGRVVTRGNFKYG